MGKSMLYIKSFAPHTPASAAKITGNMIDQYSLVVVKNDGKLLPFMEAKTYGTKATNTVAVRVFPLEGVCRYAYHARKCGGFGYNRENEAFYFAITEMGIEFADYTSYSPSDRMKEIGNYLKTNNHIKDYIVV